MLCYLHFRGRKDFVAPDFIWTRNVSFVSEDADPWDRYTSRMCASGGLNPEPSG